MKTSVEVFFIAFLPMCILVYAILWIILEILK